MYRRTWRAGQAYRSTDREGWPDMEALGGLAKYTEANKGLARYISTGSAGQVYRSTDREGWPDIEALGGLAKYTEANKGLARYIYKHWEG